MRKTFILFISIVAVFFVSCEDEQNQVIVGKWKYARLEKNGTLFLSDDPIERTQIIDKHVRENEEFIKDIPKFRKNAYTLGSFL